MTTNKQTYRFVLRPLDKVFFGGEKSPFIDEDYFLRSHFLPQQTALLGFTRYWLLRKAGLLKDSSKKGWSELIGDRSFDGSQSQTFGAIQRLTPLGVAHLDANGQVIEDFYYCQKTGDLALETAPETVKYALGDGQVFKDDFALFKAGEYAYNSKDQDKGYFQPWFWNLADDYVKVVSEPKASTHFFNTAPADHSVFIKDTKPGITKNYGGESKEDGYFKTEYYRMQRNFAYTFLVELDTTLLPENFAEPGFCRFGGDAGSVAVSIQPHEPSSAPEPNTGDCFFLLSDTLSTMDIYLHCKSARVKVVHFRNLRTANSDTNYSRRPRMWYQGREDPQHSNSGKIMLQKGSLLIAKPGQAEQLQQCLQQPAYYKIGYNHFIRLNQLP